MERRRRRWKIWSRFVIFVVNNILCYFLRIAGYFSGIVNPIEAVRRVQGAGLGSAGSKVVHNSDGTSHKERVRASMMNRYREISEK